jgi:hypothetical protein
LPGHSCFDGLHLNDLGYALMGNYIDLGLFKNQAEVAAWSSGH